MHSRYLNVAAFCLFFTPSLQALQRAPASCEQYEASLRADPNNLDAAASLGRCSVRDYVMLAPGGDSTRLMFRSSWSVALRALRHAVALDASYTAAYRPLFRILFAETRDGCSTVTWECRHVSPVLRDRDSVITIPRPVDTTSVGRYDEVIRATHATQQASLAEARALAERWVNAAPNDRRPHEYLGQALLRMGEPEAASIELERAATLGTPASRRELFWDRLEAFIKSNRGTDALRVIDEAAGDPAPDTIQHREYTLAKLNAFLGRYRPPRVDSAVLRRNLARIDSVLRSRPAVPRARPAPAFSALLSLGDTAGARGALVRLDSSLVWMDSASVFPRIGPNHLMSAEWHLALGDTAAAEARLAQIERPFNEGRFQFTMNLMYESSRPWLGRAWSLAGDLAAARGLPEKARRMYGRVIGLWGGSDPDLTPVVDHARARLNLLSPR